MEMAWTGGAVAAATDTTCDARCDASTGPGTPSKNEEGIDESIMLRTHQTRRVAVILVPDANLLQKRDPKNEEAMRQFIGPKKSLALGPRSRGLTHGRHLRSLYLLFGIGRAFLECLVAWLIVRESLVHRAVALDV